MVTKLKKTLPLELFLLAGAILLLSQLAFAEEAAKQPLRSEVKVVGEPTLGNPSEMNVVLSPAPAGRIDIEAFDNASGRSLSTSAESFPVNLWVMVDASAVCSMQKMDQHMGTILGKLKNSFSKETVLSVASFNSANLEVLVNQQKLSEVDAIPIRCDKAMFSTSYEKALRYLFEVSRPTSLPKVAWVYSSGNMQLSEEMQKRLVAEGVDVRLVLYNAIVERELRPVVEQLNKKLGRELVRLTSFNAANPELPERWFKLRISSAGTAGSKGVTGVTLRVTDGKEVRAEEGILVDFRGPRSVTLWEVLFYLAAASGIGYLGFLAFRYYYPRKCKVCAKALRPLQTDCLFCVQNDRAYLVGSFNFKNREKWEKTEVIPIRGKGGDLGTARKCLVRVPRLRGERRGSYLRIERETAASGSKPAYLAIPRLKGDYVRLNGVRLESPRYLADGDEIQISGLSARFVYERSGT